MLLIIAPIKVQAKESEKVTIYLFRGYNCAHCEEALEYINKHREEIGDNIEIVTYEVWKNSNNATLQTKIEDYLGITEADKALEQDKKKGGSVPMFVIGDYYHYGFSSTATFKEILNETNEYVNGKEYTDVVKKVLDENEINAKSMTLNDLYPEENKTVTYIVFGIFGVLIVGFIVMICFSRK